MDQLVAALFLALVTERIIQYFITPIFDKFTWDKFYIMFVALVFGAGLTLLAHINLFLPILPDMTPLVGRILTAVIVGGGSNLIHDIFDKTQPMKPTQPAQVGDTSAKLVQ